MATVAAATSTTTTARPIFPPSATARPTLIPDSLISCLTLPGPVTSLHLTSPTLVPRRIPLLDPLYLRPISDRSPEATEGESTLSDRTVRPPLRSPIAIDRIHPALSPTSQGHEREHEDQHEHQLCISPTLRPKLNLPALPALPARARLEEDPVKRCEQGVAGLVVDELDVEWCFHCERCLPRTQVELRVVKGWGQQWVCRKGCGVWDRE